MRWRGYPKYKDSGVEWLGEVPNEWSVFRIKDVSQLFGRIGYRGYSTDDLVYEGEGAVSMSPSNMMDGKIDLSKATWLSWEKYYESPEIIINNNDVVMVKTGSTLGKTAFVESIETPMTINPQLMIFKNINCNKRYLFHVVSSKLIQDIVPLLNTGSTIPTMTQNSFERLFIPGPSEKEQSAIAGFLDRETGRLDTLIAKKQALIVLLKEKRSALISQTVTRGLPADAAREFGLEPHTRFKGSGIEWLGEVPEGWEIKSITRIIKTIQTGPFGSQLHTSDYVEGGIPLINPAHICSGKLVPDELSCIDESTACRLSRHRLLEGDIIMGRRGEIGRCAIVGKDEIGWLCGTGSLVIRLGEADSRYFFRVFSSFGFGRLLELNAVGTTMLNLNPTIVGRMVVPVPLLIEQTAIATYLDRETTKIDTLIVKVETAIARLQEYRTALITAAVTGKIDVRDHASKKEAA